MYVKGEKKVMIKDGDLNFVHWNLHICMWVLCYIEVYQDRKEMILGNVDGYLN